MKNNCNTLNFRDNIGLSEEAKILLTKKINTIINNINYKGHELFFSKNKASELYQEEYLISKDNWKTSQPELTFWLEIPTTITKDNDNLLAKLVFSLNNELEIYRCSILNFMNTPIWSINKQQIDSILMMTNLKETLNESTKVITTRKCKV